MATNANWTVVFEDKCIIKNYAEGVNEGVGYKINDGAFWATTAFQNIWAIQSGTSNSSDEVEHRDETPHCSLADKGIDIQQFVDKWDAAHLTQLQSDWDNNNAVDENGDSTETEAEKIVRLGARPTSYSS
ncbi:hypothetical protein HTVC027P_gp71 [Pelagibacter phage HTVC027P]|jgi:hypothetical protein|nr:hypothetical protein HTVC027P_gp71 [Pelagibacter phage HTVC027P]